MNLLKIREKLIKNKLFYIILLLLSKLYLLIIEFREIIYKMGLFKIKIFSTPIICFGNISTGGTGKTSTVILIAKELNKLNKKVAIITRGYKKQRKTSNTMIISEDNADSAGDEAKLIYLSLKDYNIPVIVNSRRVKAANVAIENFKPDIILMDDGFQHLELYRDMNIVLINSTEQIEEKILPLGNLRESYKSLKRADIVILTHCENTTENKIENWRNFIIKYKPEIPVIESIHTPDFFFDIINLKKLDISYFKNKDIVSMSSIGDPRSFEKIISNLNINIKKSWIFPDHYKYNISDIIAIENLRNNLPIITTYKDYVKLPYGWEKIIKKDFYVLSIKISFIGNGYKILTQKILEKIK